MPGWDELAAEVGKATIGGVSPSIGYGIGELTGYNKALANDQLEQQDKLDEIQQKYNFASMDKVYDMSSPTNQLKRIKDAGLNPALMYGGAGAGGSNPSALATGGASASNESERRQNDIAQAAMGVQLAKMQSEIRLNDSVTAKNNSEIPVNQANIPRIGAETTGQNLKNKEQIFKNNIAEIDANIKNATADTVVDTAKQGLAKLEAETDKIYAETENAIELKNNIAVDTALKANNIKLNNEKIQQIKQEIKQSIEETKAIKFNSVTERFNAITQRYSARLKPIMEQQGFDIEQEKGFMSILGTLLGATIIGGMSKLNTPFNSTQIKEKSKGYEVNTTTYSR